MGNESEKGKYDYNKNKSFKDKKKQIKNKNDKIPDSFELILNIKFNTEYFTIHELSYDRIGILSKLNLYIYSLYTFKQIDIIKMQLPKNIFFKLFGEEKHYEDDTNKDFLELYNSDIVIWSRNLILLYKLTNKGYQCYQNLKSNYLISSVYELKNKDLATCGSFGLNIYSKEKNKYSLIEEYPLNSEVIKIIGKKENSFILIQNKNKYSKNFVLTLYDTEGEDDDGNVKYDGNTYFSESPRFAMKNNYFVFNFNKECVILDKNNLSLKNKFQEYNFLGDFFDDFILIKDEKNKIINIGEYKDGNINICKSIPFYFDNIIKLSNGNIIGINRNQIKIINCIRNL